MQWCACPFFFIASACSRRLLVKRRICLASVILPVPWPRLHYHPFFFLPQTSMRSNTLFFIESCFQMTKWLGLANQPVPEGWQWKLRGVADSLRLSPFRLHYWTPPGLLDHVRPPQKTVFGKVLADAMEAIIGVFYEALGPARNNCWLACMGLLPGAPTVRCCLTYHDL